MKQKYLPKELSVTLNPKGVWRIIVFVLAVYGLFVGAAIWNDQPLFLPFTAGIVLLVFPIGMFLALSAAKVTVDTEVVTLRLWCFVLKRIPLKEIQTLICYRGRRGCITMLVLCTDTPDVLEARGRHALENSYGVRSELRTLSIRPEWNDLCLGAGLGLGLLKKHSFWVEYSPERQQLLESLFPNCPFRTSNDYRDPPISMENK